MKNQVAFLLVALLVLTTLQSLGSNYYVDPSSSGSNQGTFSNPWKSIADVPQTIGCFQPGDTIFFKSGQQFTGPLYINCSGSSGAPIVFMPYGSGAAPLFQYNLANPNDALVYNRSIISMNQANYIVIDGFNFTDLTMPETDHSITANAGYGVYVYNGSNNIIKNLTVTKVGCGVSLDGGSYNTVTNCSISNLRMILNTPDIAWDDFGAMGIEVGGSNNTISYNQIHDCYGNSYDYEIDGGAVEMFGAVSDNKIMYNTCAENLGFMEFGSSTSAQALNNVIAYNLLINNGHVFWINTNNGYGVDVRNLQFLNNNVLETHAPRLADVTNMIGIATTPTIANVLTMKNNIFWINTSCNITDPVTQSFNGPQLVHESNLYHLSGGSLGFTLNVPEKILNTTDQLFKDTTVSTNPALWDYHLQPTSAAIGIGQSTGIDKDYYGQAVPLSGLSDAGIAENISTTTTVILPVQFIAVKGSAGTNGNLITWETSNDPADHFEVERSNTGNDFTTIATVAYSANAGANTLKYQYLDNNVKSDVEYYRIKVVEPGGTVAYSQIISLKNTPAVAIGNLIAFPNPARDYIYLKMAGGDFNNKEVQIINMSGIVLKKERLNNASSQVKLTVSMLSRGAYVIKLVNRTTGNVQSITFIKL